MNPITMPSHEQSPSVEWSRAHRIAISVPIFVVLLAIFVTVSQLTSVSWNNEPMHQSLASETIDTGVTFANPQHIDLPQAGTYQVSERHAQVTITQPSTGNTQQVDMLVREPVGAPGQRPAILFMHGAGGGTSEDSYGDVAGHYSSAGFVTVVIDKPSWQTNVLTRDYPASAIGYLKAYEYLRNQPNVDAENVGLYATSESTWIASLMLEADRSIAFQILISPMVFTPRQVMGFLVAQNVVSIGANPGYEAFVHRLFSLDSTPFGLTNADFDATTPHAYAAPTLVIYGSDDAMTPLVEGAQRILASAHDVGNDNVTIRNYPGANHVIRMGDESQGNTQLADRFLDDTTDWALGQVHGLQQTSPNIAGSDLNQTIAVPKDLKAHPSLTWYMILLHTAALLGLVLAAIMWFAVLIRTIVNRVRGVPVSLGYQYGFAGVMRGIATTTVITIALFVGGLLQVIDQITHLCWGGNPNPTILTYYSWPTIQVMCVAVIWAWARVTARIVEVSSSRGVSWIFPLNVIRNLSQQRSGTPVVATSATGRLLFAVTSVTMFLVLLVFAFWGLFQYVYSL